MTWQLTGARDASTDFLVSSAGVVGAAADQVPNGLLMPENWSRKLQKKWYATSVLNQITNTDWEGDLKGPGQNVFIRKRPNAYVSRHSANQKVVWQALTDSKIELKITEAFNAAIKFDDTDLASFDINMFNEMTDELSNRHMNKEDEYVFTALPTVATTVLPTVNVVAAADYDKLLTALSTARTKLDRLFVPRAGRFFACPPEVGEVLLHTSQAVYTTSGEVNDQQRYGVLSKPIYGFTIIETTFVNGNGSAAGVPWKCIAGTKDGFCFARKITKTEGPMPLQDYYGQGMKTLNCFGGGVTQPDALVLIPVATVA
jgi:hypothetical protein